jgi:anti-sigma B factor antagonist
MSVNIKETYNAAVIEVKGKLIGGPLSEEIGQKLHNLIDKGQKNVVVDLGGVNYISSSGLGILISGLASVKKNGGDLKLANISDKIEGLLSITKLNQIFEQFDTVEKAAKSYSK